MKNTKQIGKWVKYTSLQQIAEDCQSYVRIKQDSKKKLKNPRIVYCLCQKNMLQKETKTPIKFNETKKKQNILPLTHVPDVEPYTGTKIVFSGTRSDSYVTKSDTKACMANLKIEPVAT